MKRFFPIVKIGNPILRKVTKKIPLKLLKRQAFKALVRKMAVTMHHENGVGLAANQIGYDGQLLVLECRANLRYPSAPAIPFEVYLNPKIISYSRERVYEWEGCLSIPGYRGLVPRSKEVTFTAYDLEGKKVTKTVSGFHARIIQHEVDHLNGFVYVDRMDDLTEWAHTDEFNRLLGTDVKDVRNQPKR
jgi:peptide deformylase